MTTVQLKEKVTAWGEKHGLINVIASSVEDNGFKHFKPEMKAKAEKKRKEENEIVKAKYLNSRGQNERLSKPYCRWAGDPIQFWHFIPGEEYEVPRGLIDEVNSPHARLPKRSQICDANGVPTQVDGASEIIHQFVPVAF